MHQVDWNGEEPTPDPTPTPGLNPVNSVPKGSQLFQIPMGPQFWAPPQENFKQIYQAGVRDKALSKKRAVPFAALWWLQNKAVGHFGKYDCQRKIIKRGDPNRDIDDTFNFYSKYTNAANFNVGLYLAGAGYTEEEALKQVWLFQLAKMTSNYGSQK